MSDGKITTFSPYHYLGVSQPQTADFLTPETMYRRYITFVIIVSKEPEQKAIV